ncbi:universal stress protein [Ekhidna sp.]|jgi:nucleotide-binding universal stress UspA family protein|uniref:universal stress protein n=1 Tax=Ekhidna sp. TaxID=2608089 RepID=UPI0032F01816
MKNILVPTDFSNLSEYALEFAISLAEPLGARVTVIHCEEVPLGDMSLHLSGEAGGSSISEDSLFNAQLFRANKQKLKALEQDFTTEKVLVHSQQYGGGFLKGITHYIEKHPVDLVVIGTTGQESIQEFFSGNHTEQLIDNLTVPVVSLQDQQFHPIEDIVLGLDMEDEKYTQKAFEQVKVICEALGSTLHIIDVTKTKDDEEMMQLLNKVAKIVNLSNYMVDVIEDRNPNEALLDYAEGTDAGLIIVLSEAKGGLYRFFNHSFASKLTKKSSIPVMTINKRNL